MKYLAKVINVTTNLRIRKVPNINEPIIGRKYNGDEFIVTELKNTNDGYQWCKLEDGSGWCCIYDPTTKTNYLSILKDLEQTVTVTPEPPPQKKEDKIEVKKIPTSNALQLGINTINDVSKSSKQTKIPNSIQAVGVLGSDILKNFSKIKLYDNKEYPMKLTNEKYPEYDYSLNDYQLEEFKKAFKKIRKQLNIINSYSKEELNKLTHTMFNRFKLDDPNLYMGTTIPVIIFTRPDINLFEETGDVTAQAKNDPRTYAILLKNELSGKLLTARGDGTYSHVFNPLLSNLAQNIEVSDDIVDTLETGETYTGFKTQYAKHMIKSLSAGSIQIKYRETFDRSIIDMHQLWCDYESNVFRGSFDPRYKYIWNKEIDYACDLYYFLLAHDAETIIFWSKYFGVFPLNVPKSIFSVDMGSNVSYPEPSVNYAYMYKEDMSPLTFVEFNANSGVKDFKYIKNFDKSTLVSGSTWVNTPFIQSYNYKNGIQNALGYKFRWTPPPSTSNT